MLKVELTCSFKVIEIYLSLNFILKYYIILIPITNDLIFGWSSRIENQQTIFAVETLRKTISNKRMRTSGMRTIYTSTSFLHLNERWIIVTIRTERVV